MDGMDECCRKLIQALHEMAAGFTAPQEQFVDAVLSEIAKASQANPELGQRIVNSLRELHPEAVRLPRSSLWTDLGMELGDCIFVLRDLGATENEIRLAILLKITSGAFPTN